jgi:hypothetical protein
MYCDYIEMDKKEIEEIARWLGITADRVHARKPKIKPSGWHEILVDVDAALEQMCIGMVKK